MIHGRAAPGQLVRVFLVEDNRNMLAALTSLLAEDEGFAIVGTAATAAAATQWLFDNKGGWDVISIDLILDDGSGFGLIKRAKTQAEHRIVVVFSEYVTDVIREQCERFGADAVFNKTDIRRYADFMYALRPPRPAGN